MNGFLFRQLFSLLPPPEKKEREKKEKKEKKSLLTSSTWGEPRMPLQAC